MVMAAHTSLRPMKLLKWNGVNNFLRSPTRLWWWRRLCSLLKAVIEDNKGQQQPWELTHSSNCTEKAKEMHKYWDIRPFIKLDKSRGQTTCLFKGSLASAFPAEASKWFKTNM